MWGGAGMFAGGGGGGGFWSGLAKSYAGGATGAKTGMQGVFGGGGGGGGMMGAGGMGQQIAGMISNTQRPNFSGGGSYGGGPGQLQTGHSQTGESGIAYQAPPPPSAMALRPRQNPMGDVWGPVIDRLLRQRAGSVGMTLPGDTGASGYGL